MRLERKDEEMEDRDEEEQNKEDEEFMEVSSGKDRIQDRGVKCSYCSIQCGSTQQLRRHLVEEDDRGHTCLEGLGFRDVEELILAQRREKVITCF